MNIQDKTSRYVSIFFKMLRDQYNPETDGPPEAFISGKLERLKASLENGPHGLEERKQELRLARQAAVTALEDYREIYPDVDAKPVEEEPDQYEPQETVTKRRWPSRKFWVRYLTAVFILATYIVSNIYFKSEDVVPPSATKLENGVTGIKVDVEIADFNNKSLTLLFTPDAGNLVRSDGMLDKDIALLVDGGKGFMRHEYKANEPIVPFSAEIEIDTGDILDYPFDSYEAAVNVQGLSLDKPIPIDLVLNHVPHGIKAYMSQRAGQDEEVGERIYMTRSFIGKFAIGLSVFSVILVCVSSIWVAYFLYVTRKSFGFDVLVWTAALLFVIPTVRDSLPGKPPLGCSIDFLVFFWLQAFVAVATIALVYAWYRHMSRPEEAKS